MKELNFTPCYIDGKKAGFLEVETEFYHNATWYVLYNSDKLFTSNERTVKELKDAGISMHQFFRAEKINDYFSDEKELSDYLQRKFGFLNIIIKGDPGFDELATASVGSRSGGKQEPKQKPKQEPVTLDCTSVVSECLTKSLGNLSSIVTPEVSKVVNNYVNNEIDNIINAAQTGSKEQIIRICSPNKTTEIQGLAHDKLKVVLTLMQSRNVYLYGPAGTGKSILAKQVAEAFGLDFYPIQKIDDIYTMLSGFIDANGKFVETPFYQAFTKGGLFFCDELDISDPGAVSWLNGAIENGFATFPGVGRVQAHEKFKCISAGNTNGLGATDEYNASNVLTEAFRRRFAFVEVDYCKDIDIANANNDVELYNFAIDVRNACKKLGIKLIFSSAEIKHLKNFDGVLTDVENVNYNLLKGIDKDAVNMIANNIGESKWQKALKKLAS